MLQEPRADQLPEIFMPEQAATVVAPNGNRMLFLRVPQVVPMLKEILTAQPGEVTYRWAYHPGHQIYVLFVVWSSGHQMGLAIPEDVGASVLDFLAEGPADVMITEAEVEQTLQSRASKETIEGIVYGTTIPVPEVKFQRQT